jgi:hypothetical protein
LNDYIKMGIAYVLFVIITSLCFFKDGFHAFTTATALFYIFTLPGFVLLSRKKFLERLILGTILGFAMIGIFSYYIGLLGLPIKYHLIIPTIITIIGFTKEVYYGDTKKS